MSRGPGRVERVVEATFAANPSGAYLFDDLALLVYPGINRAEKRHRVAVRRAVANVAPRLWWTWTRREARPPTCVCFNLLDERSYVIGKAFVEYSAYFTLGQIAEIVDGTFDGSDPWRRPERLREKYCGPDSPWQDHVRINRLRVAGRDE